MHDFVTKRNALFACLDDASSELRGTILDQTNSTTALRRTSQGELEMNYIQDKASYTSSDRSLHLLRGKESIFKKPELPISRCLKPRKLADYQINPHKWKKYSLEDVDISEQTNSSAALQFLQQIEERKNTDKCLEDDGPQKRIEFKKSSKIRRNLKSKLSVEQLDAEIDSPKLKGSKLVMPEYVVGQNKTTSLKKKSLNIIHKTERKERAVGKLLLSHLQDDEEEHT